MLPQLEVGTQIIPLAQQKGTVGEEAGVGAEAKWDVWNSNSEGEGGFGIWNLEGIDTGDLKVPLQGRGYGFPPE